MYLETVSNLKCNSVVLYIAKTLRDQGTREHLGTRGIVVLKTRGGSSCSLGNKSAISIRYLGIGWSWLENRCSRGSLKRKHLGTGGLG